MITQTTPTNGHAMPTNGWGQLAPLPGALPVAVGDHRIRPATPSTAVAIPTTPTPDRPVAIPDPTTTPDREAATAVEPTGSTDEQATPKMSKGAYRVLVAVAAFLAAVILAPIALSAQDLYHWAAAPRGLGLKAPWPYLVPVALDLAAAACIGMTIVAAWRRDRAGVFGLLVWVFAATSAYAQVTHGFAERDAGRAQDAWWAMPAFALLGPLLLEVTLNRVRKWAREDTGEQHKGAAGFGNRWLPGVAFRETLAAWATSRREGIDKAADAVQFVRDRDALKTMSLPEAVHYAFDALESTDPYRVRVWLTARKVVVDQKAIEAATASRLRVDPVGAYPPATTTPPVADRETPTPDPATAPTPSRETATTDAYRSAPTAPRETKPPADRKAATTRPSPAPTGKRFAPVAIRDATQIRKDLGTVGDDLLPGRNELARKYEWNPPKATEARRAYLAGADLASKETSR